MCRWLVTGAIQALSTRTSNRSFLFLTQGQTGNYGNLSKVVRHLHLAFKGMETEEVYDVLMEQLLGAIKG